MKELLKQFAYFKSKSEYTFLTKKHTHTHTHTSPVISEKKADDFRGNNFSHGPSNVCGVLHENQD